MSRVRWGKLFLSIGPIPVTYESLPGFKYRAYPGIVLGESGRRPQRFIRNTPLDGQPPGLPMPLVDTTGIGP